MPNPSALFLAERPVGAPGSAVLCCLEGTRPMLVEVQALVSTQQSTAARAAWPSASIRTACRCCWPCSRSARACTCVGDDVFVNIAGGMSIDEPAVDLGIVAAVASSVRNRPIRAGHRGVRRGRAWAARCAACRRRRCASVRPSRWGSRALSCPRANMDAESTGMPERRELVGVRTVGEALDVLLS